MTYTCVKAVHKSPIGEISDSGNVANVDRGSWVGAETGCSPTR